MSETNEVVSLVEAAQSKSKFNLAEVIKGRGYPEDSVTVYLDVASAYELSKLNDQLINTVDGSDTSEIEAQIKELEKKILDSRLVFHMRGIDQKQVEAIEANTRKDLEEENEEWVIDYMCALVAANIVSVEGATGEKEERLFTLEDVTELRGVLSGEAWDSLIATMQKLTLATGYFKGLTDAGFLQKS